tara:strand:+ start:1286 stop:1486 length:201 start_codon:yes stop_codon:yes gene_type:complete
MTKFTELSDQDLYYIEKLLGNELGKEIEARKTWNDPIRESKPSQIRTCINAVRSQRNTNKLKSEKW